MVSISMSISLGLLVSLMLISIGRTQYSEIVARIRANILDNYNSNADQFSSADIKRLSTSNWYIERFVIDQNGNEAKSYEAILASLRHRKHTGVNDRDDAYFPAEFYAIGHICWNCEWNDGGRVLIKTENNYYPVSALRDLYLQFVLHLYNKVDLNISVTQNASWNQWTNLANWTLTKYDLINLKGAIEFYSITMPLYPKQLVVTGMDPASQVVWSLSRSLFPLRFLNKFELSADGFKYVDVFSLPKYLGGYDLSYKRVPPGVKSGKCLPHLRHIKNEVWEEFYDKHITLLASAAEEYKSPTMMDFYKC